MCVRIPGTPEQVDDPIDQSDQQRNRQGKNDRRYDYESDRKDYREDSHACENLDRFDRAIHRRLNRGPGNLV